MTDLSQIKKYISSSPSYTHWEKIGVHHHHGICVPIFSLHTKNSCGTGEFLDLLPIIGWCHDLKLDVIQLLPMNESNNDPSPYNALSSCALHPIYLSLHRLPYAEESPDLLLELEEMRKLNALQRINYHKVKRLKFAWLKKYFHNNKKKLLSDPKFISFVENNSWLEEYGLFKVLQKELKKSKWQHWPEKYKNISDKVFSALVKTHYEKLLYYYVLQYLCFSQMQTIKEHAAKKKVFIKGDIPILINANSCDVWKNKSVFDMSHVAGAAPDDYDAKGQKWNFPIFNWNHLQKTNFEWWRRRLNVASLCYHIYRIDHTVGFFRFWAIPPKGRAIHGKFLPKNPDLWGNLGKENLLMMLGATQTFPIAEDLGLIPKITYEVLFELGICGTKVIRWQQKNDTYIPYCQYSPLSMTTVGTHDFEPLQQWWKDYPKQAKEFAIFKNWKYTPTLTKEQQKEILFDSHHTPSLFHINPLQEYLTLFDELSWGTPQEERINVGGKVLSSNWKYRFKPSVETICAHKQLASEMKDIVFS